MKDLDFKSIGKMVLFAALVIVFWNSPIVYPIKAFTVLIHEGGHGLAAILTGGSIDRIELGANLGGTCWTRGGSRLAILPAGYLGSMSFGAALLLFASRTKLDHYASLIIGLIIILITTFYIRTTFGFVVGIGFGLFLGLSGMFLGEKINDLILRCLGLTSMLYAIADIKDDLITRTVPGSDAYAMSEIIPLPSVVWGIIWMAFAICFSSYCVIKSSKKGIV